MRPSFKDKSTIDITSQCYPKFHIDRETYNVKNKEYYGQPLEDTDLEIYVDASIQSNQEAGTGLYIRENSRHHTRKIGPYWISDYCYLGKQTSVLLCETVAIYLASAWIIKNPHLIDESSVAIYTDCQNAIKSLERLNKSYEHDAALENKEPPSYNVVLKAMYSLARSIFPI